MAKLPLEVPPPTVHLAEFGKDYRVAFSHVHIRDGSAFDAP
jgi:hypothetical protein